MIRGEIKEAADRLEAALNQLPQTPWGNRPWHAEECSDTDGFDECTCILAQGEYQEFDKPQDPPVQYIADVELLDFVPYLITMQPVVGHALLPFLRSWQDTDVIEAGPMAEDLRHALTIARAINSTPK